MKIFKTIRMRLLIVPMVAVTASLMTTALGLYGLTMNSRALQSASTATSAIMHQMSADMMHDAIRADVQRSILIGPTGTARERELAQSGLDEHIVTFKAEMATLLALDLPPESRELVVSLDGQIQVYFDSALATVRLGITDTEAAKAMLPKFQADFTILEYAMGDVGDSLLMTETSASKQARQKARLLVILMAASLVAAIVTFAIATTLVGRSIIRPVARVNAAIQQIGNGNLTVEIMDTVDVGEMGEIARSLDRLREKLVAAEAMERDRERSRVELRSVTEALSIGLKDLSVGDFSRPIQEPFAEAYEMLRMDFNLALDKLNLAISKVVSSTESIRARSTEVNRATEDLARRTETQAATLEQTAAAMDQMTRSVKSAATSTKEVETIVRQARKEAEDSGAVVQGAVAAMIEIEKSSHHISQIIGVIDDIAFQTNLLALNAGVEAARAGDAGRGFAVVASEVGALAQRSSVAAKEIKTLIGASTQHVGVGVDQVGLAGSALSSIVERVTQISTLVSIIASGAGEQSTGLAEINIGVTQLDSATQQNAAMVEETTAASQLLNQNVIDLQEMMSQFTVTTDELAPFGVVLDISAPTDRSASTPRQRSVAKPAREMRAVAAINGASIWQDF